MKFSEKRSTVKLATSGVVQTVQGKQIVSRNAGIIADIVGAEQAAGAADAIKAAKEVASLGAFGVQPGLGGQNGLDIAGGQQHHDSNKYSIPMPGMPSGRDLQTQDDDSPTATHSHDGSGDSRSTRGSAWTERTTERSSSDGMRTWGSASYRDWSGNFWRSDYTIERSSDGSTTSKDTVFDSHNEPIKTTVIYTAPDGSEKVTTTDHQTGQTTTTQGTVKPETPEPEEGADAGKPGKDKNQGETSGYTTTATPKSFVSPNKVNPGPDASDAPAGPVEPVRFDPNILVTDPAPDQVVENTHAPKDITRQNVNINTIDPPRPQ